MISITSYMIHLTTLLVKEASLHNMKSLMLISLIIGPLSFLSSTVMDQGATALA